jgi:hypothetical protein
MKSLITAIFYLLACLSCELCFGYQIITAKSFLPTGAELLIECMLLAGLGGILYCLRGVYISYCVKKIWTDQWLVWYFLRPIVSILCGGVSFLFLKAGLLVLEAKKESESSNLGFLAFAFIAGMNVDKFIAKIEDLAKATWGVEKSRSSGGAQNGDQPGNQQTNA